MKYFITSDIHGFYDEFKKALKDNEFDINNKDHHLIICGDIFDRGSQVCDLLDFLIEMNNQKRLIFIRGNHEDLIFDCVNELRENNGCASSHHYSNGTVDTISQLLEKNYLQKALNFINEVSINYFELDDYIFVHGWIPVIKHDDLPIYYSSNRDFTFNPNWRNANIDEWKQARWLNGMELANKGIIEKNKKIICGHWHTSYGNLLKGICEEEFPKEEPKFKKAFQIYENKGIIALDACTAYSHFVNVLVIEKN